MNVRIEEVSGRAGLGAFIRLPFHLYRGDACFVPPLLRERRCFFSTHNPLFAFTDVAYFLARDERGKPVGRVTAHINHRHLEQTGEAAGFFGFFESVEDPEVARELMNAAENWLRTRTMRLIRGPFNFSTNEECGFLAEGFDSPPAIMMTYTPRYYLDFMAQLGYRKAKDLLAYGYSYQGRIPEYLVRFRDRVVERAQVTIRPFNSKDFMADVKRAFATYNAAWEDNWGFIPMTEDEFVYAAKELKSVLDPALALIAEKDGKAVGFLLALPDFNIVLKKMRGRLFPFGFMHALLARRSIHHVRVVLLGVVREFRKTGLDIALYHDVFKSGLARGYTSCEMSWVLEDNVLMLRAMERMGAVKTKVYRLYEKAL